MYNKFDEPLLFHRTKVINHGFAFSDHSNLHPDGLSIMHIFF
jgi:hypothetical protein